jgi:hypothetical protein
MTDFCPYCENECFKTFRTNAHFYCPDCVIGHFLKFIFIMKEGLDFKELILLSDMQELQILVNENILFRYFCEEVMIINPNSPTNYLEINTKDILDIEINTNDLINSISELTKKFLSLKEFL